MIKNKVQFRAYQITQTAVWYVHLIKTPKHIISYRVPQFDKNWAYDDDDDDDDDDELQCDLMFLGSWTGCIKVKKSGMWYRQSHLKSCQ